MAVTLIPKACLPQGRPIAIAGRWVTMTLPDSRWVGVLRRPAVLAALGYAAVFPILQVALLAESTDGGARRAVWALAATAWYLPFHLRHVSFAARGERPPFGLWTLAAMAVIIGGVSPLAGPSWLPMFHALVVSTLIVLPPRYAAPIVTALVAIQAPLAIALHSDQPAAASYYVLTVAWRSAAVFVPIKLLGAIHELNAARGRLARDALIRERVDIDVELRRTVGTALGSIADRGQRAAGMLDEDVASVPSQLQSLVDSARATIADTRALLNGYHRPSLHAELQTAITLLLAAGVDAQLSLSADLPEVSNGEFRTALQATTALLLRDERGGPFVLVVSRVGSAARLDLQGGRSAPFSRSVVRP